MSRTAQKQWVWAVALAAGVLAAPGAIAPIAPAAPAPIEPSALPHPTPAFGFPVFGRSELRLLLSKRLKLVLNYSPTAFC